MIRQAFAETREKIVADAIREVVSELRMVDVADYIAFIRMERFATIGDLVQSAAERYLQPGTLALGHGGDAHVGWAETPRIVLDLELKPRGATVYFALSMSAETAGIKVNYVSFDEPQTDPEVNTEYLKAALAGSRIKPTSAQAA
ncbi:MAG: hypothetical protein AB7I79_01670 [Rhizobiaceae bacterium]